MCVLVNSMCSLEKHLFSYLTHFVTGLFAFFILSCMSSLDILDIKPLVGHVICKYFLPFSRLPFHYMDGFLCSGEACKFD